MDVLRGIDDPEMPISIVDLGIVEDVAMEDGGRVVVTILPTFVGCPALDMIRRDIVAQVGELEGVAEVSVRFVHDPPWSVDRISIAGRAQLAEHGVATPGTCGEAGAVVSIETLRTSAIACPFCGSRDTRLESAFGPTRCRMIHYCDGCGNTFERMKRV